MKKKIIIVAALFVAGIAGSSQAAFTPVPGGKKSVVASFKTGGSGATSYDLVVRDTKTPDITPQTPKDITWTPLIPSDMSPGTWKIADQCVYLYNLTLSKVSSGIQIFTDNMTSTPKFKDLTPDNKTNADSDPSGILLNPAGQAETPITLAWAWSIKDAPKTVENSGAYPPTVEEKDQYKYILPTDPNDNKEHGKNPGKASSYQWLFIQDKKTPAIDIDGDGKLGEQLIPFQGLIIDEPNAWVDGIEYASIATENGLHYAQGPGDFPYAPLYNSQAWVYIQNNYGSALPAADYKSTLYFELFTK